MLGRTIRSLLVTGAFPLLGLVLGACQDYGFEELPSSVIREKRYTTTINLASDVDILFVVDNSGSMVGEQIQLATSFASLTAVLDERFGVDKYQIAVITTGMESPGCPRCDAVIDISCMNETGENGRFQDRRGRITDNTQDPPVFSFEPSDPTCRIVRSSNLGCFYDAGGGGVYGSGIVFVGTNGCGYERGLEPMRVALSDLASSYNANFIRPGATLAVVVVSDEEDCGRIGDVTESISGIGGKVCYYAAKGVGPDGATVDPLAGKAYTLTPVQEYYDFLMDLKNDQEGMVKFVAVVGVEDETNPGLTEINYDGANSNANILPACLTPGCTSTGDSCKAFPGTRYVELAEKFVLGENGMVGSICKNDFSDLMEQIGEFVSCPRVFKLSDAILDPALANILINDVAVPRNSCTVTDQIIPCEAAGAEGCPAGSNCVETWTYHPFDPAIPDAPGGTITFADHYQPCDLFEGQNISQVKFEVVYVTQ